MLYSCVAKASETEMAPTRHPKIREGLYLNSQHERSFSEISWGKLALSSDNIFSDIFCRPGVLWNICKYFEGRMFLKLLRRTAPEKPEIWFIIFIQKIIFQSIRSTGNGSLMCPSSSVKFSLTALTNIYQAEADATAETLYSNEQRNVDQKLWLMFQNTASAIAQLYKGAYVDICFIIATADLYLECIFSVRMTIAFPHSGIKHTS